MRAAAWKWTCRLGIVAALAGSSGCSYMIQVLGNFADGQRLTGAFSNGALWLDTSDGTTCSGATNIGLVSGGGELTCRDGRSGSYSFRRDNVSLFPLLGSGDGWGTGEIGGKSFQFRAGPLPRDGK